MIGTGVNTIKAEKPQGYQTDLFHDRGIYIKTFR